jgi:hypothetical protein
LPPLKDVPEPPTPLEPSTNLRTELESITPKKNEPAGNFWDSVVSEAVRNISSSKAPATTHEEDADLLLKAIERSLLPQKVRRLERDNKRITRLLKKQKNSQLPPKRKQEPRTQIIVDPFEHSDDYRWIQLRNQEYRLTSMQAQIIQILHKTHLDGKPEIGMDHILAEVEARSSRLRDIFRSRPGAWRDLIKKTSRGVIRLNI